MAARKRSAPLPGPTNLFESLGPLGAIVACMPSHAQALIRGVVAASAAASIARKHRKLIFAAIDKACDDIQASGRRALDGELQEDQEDQAWLRRQLAGLEGGGR